MRNYCKCIAEQAGGLFGPCCSWPRCCIECDRPAFDPDWTTPCPRGQWDAPDYVEH